MISFRLGTLPVAIRPVFFLTVVVIGLIGPPRELASLLLWVAIVLVSVLLHELGHALSARRYGATAEIELFAMGGLTRWHRDPPVGPGGRVLIAAAGSAVGIAIGLIVFLVFRDNVRSFSPLVEQAIQDFVFVNLGWGILNWLPIRLLDGGHILAGLLEIWFPKSHERISRGVFMASSIALIGLALWLQQFWLAILFALFGFTGESQARTRPTPAAGESQASLEEIRRAFAAGEYQLAADEAAAMLPSLDSAEAKTTASNILIRALLAQGRALEASELLESAPEGFRPGPVDVGVLLLAAGRIKSSIQTLSAALTSGHRDALPPLVRAYEQAGAFTEAVSFLEQVSPELLDPQPVRALGEAAQRAGAPGDAAELRRLAIDLESQVL